MAVALSPNAAARGNNDTAWRDAGESTISTPQPATLEWRRRIPYFDAGDVAAKRRRKLSRTSAALTERIVQLDIFPEARHVEAVDPRVAIGPDTRVSALYRVRYGDAPVVHQVYHDRHGWYCSEHGPTCSAVSDAVDVAVSR